MHPYATDFKHRPRLTAILFVISGVVATAIGFYLAKLQPFIGQTAGGFSSLAVFGSLHWLLDSHLWKFQPLRNLLLVPDLNGTWNVIGKTTHGPDEQQVGLEWKAELEIVQSWTRIIIVLKSNQSTSRSDSASIFHAPGEGFSLVFHYGNKPGIGETSLKQHAGTCQITFDHEGTNGAGIYFNDHNRQTAGSMHLTRKVNL